MLLHATIYQPVFLFLFLFLTTFFLILFDNVTITLYIRIYILFKVSQIFFICFFFCCLLFVVCVCFQCLLRLSSPSPQIRETKFYDFFSAYDIPYHVRYHNPWTNANYRIKEEKERYNHNTIELNV